MPGRTRSIKVVAAILFRQTLRRARRHSGDLLGRPGGDRGRLLSRAEAVPQTVPALYPLYGPTAAWPYRLPRIGSSQIAHGVSARTLVRTPGRCHGASLPVGPLRGSRTGLPTWPQGGGPNFVAARSPLGPVDRVSVRCSGGRRRAECRGACASGLLEDLRPAARWLVAASRFKSSHPHRKSLTPGAYDSWSETGGFLRGLHARSATRACVRTRTGARRPGSSRPGRR